MDRPWSVERLPVLQRPSRWSVLFGVGALAFVVVSLALGWTYASLANHPAMQAETVIVKQAGEDRSAGQPAVFAADEVAPPHLARAVAE